MLGQVNSPTIDHGLASAVAKADWVCPLQAWGGDLTSPLQRSLKIFLNCKHFFSFLHNFS